MKRYPEDVAAGDLLEPYPDGAAHFGFTGPAKVEMVIVLKTERGNHYQFQVYTCRDKRRKRMELGSAWFKGFAGLNPAHQQ